MSVASFFSSLLGSKRSNESGLRSNMSCRCPSTGARSLTNVGFPAIELPARTSSHDHKILGVVEIVFLKTVKKTND